MQPPARCSNDQCVYIDQCGNRAYTMWLTWVQTLPSCHICACPFNGLDWLVMLDADICFQVSPFLTWGWGWRRLTGLNHPVKYFTDRSKVVLLLWIFYVFVLSCVCYVFVRVFLYVFIGHLLGKGWPLGSRLWCLLWVCHFPIGILGQVWYLIVSIPDLCTLTYFDMYVDLRINIRTKEMLNITPCKKCCFI